MSLRTCASLSRAAGLELGWGLLAVRAVVREWRGLAGTIPDERLRLDAVNSIDDKRYYVDGAALFWTLPSGRSRALLTLLATYQTIANYLDYASERGAVERGASGGSLMLALVDAVDVGGPIHDYYEGHPWRDDGGYLLTLVMRCREACATLPQYETARPLVLREARRAEALELCHDPHAARRDAALTAFATREFSGVSDAAWFELAGSATSLLGVIVLLALAAEPDATTADLASAAAAYAPWVGALSLLLDSFFDQDNDALTGAWSAVAYYPSTGAAFERIHELTSIALLRARALRRGERHTVIIAMMVAMYLSGDDAVAGRLAIAGRHLSTSNGGLITALVPVMRFWRVVYGQR